MLKSNAPEIDDRNYLEEYKILTGLFQFYLQLIVTTLNYVFLISGGVLAYVLNGLSDCENSIYLKVGLLIPALICGAIGVGFMQAVNSSRELTMAITILKEKLKLNLAPHTENLTKSLQWSGMLLITMSTCLFGFFFKIYIWN